MRVTVLTLTRDRLDYTQRCFKQLELTAGTKYRHLVLDQGSDDGTPDWLREWRADKPADRQVIYSPTNIGIGQGLNALLNIAGENDVLVKFDNDCFIERYGTLKAAVGVARERRAVVSPKILGLRNPPQPVGEFAVRVGDEAFMADVMPMIGGIFLAGPADLWGDWRYPNDLPVWGGDDTLVCQRAAILHRMPSLYLRDFYATHIEGTDEQHVRYPEYFDRRVQEGGPE